MHYPMSAALTGLDHDIEYNYSLSDMDKAYMCIMYPRPGNTTHSKAPEWSFDYALAKTGIVREDPETAQRIMDAYHDGHDATGTSVDPQRVRELFGRWCSRSLAARQI